MSRIRITITDEEAEERERRYLEECASRYRAEEAQNRGDWSTLLTQMAKYKEQSEQTPPKPKTFREKVCALIQERYNQASISHNKPEVASAMKELLEQIDGL